MVLGEAIVFFFSWHSTLPLRSVTLDWLLKIVSLSGVITRLSHQIIVEIKTINIKHLAHTHKKNNEISEREIKETIPFITASRRIKYLGINLRKEAKDLYSEDY